MKKAREKLDTARNAFEIALSRGDNETAARYKYGIIPGIEEEIRKHEEDVKALGAGALLR